MKDALEVAGNGCCYVLTAVQPDYTLRIISLVLSILISLVILISKIYEWYKKSKQDGKITKEEVKEGIDIASKGAKDLADEIVDVVEAIEESKKGSD